MFSGADHDAGGAADGPESDASGAIDTGIDVTTAFDAAEDAVRSHDGSVPPLDGSRPKEASTPPDDVISPPPADAPADVVPPPPQTDAGDVVPCLVDHDILYLDGDSTDYIHPGTATITNATWTPSTSPSGSAQPYTVSIHLVPTDQSQGLWWDADFSSQQLNQPLAVQSYPDAQRLPFATSGHPGLEVTGDGRGCNTITGSFVVYQIDVDASGTLHAFTASFVQHCESGTAALRGCVHVQQ